jgi:hypothetical protein
LAFILIPIASYLQKVLTKTYPAANSAQNSAVEDVMKQLAEKLVFIEHEVSSEKGEFSLFGLFLREDLESKWDLVVSASWIEPDKEHALDYLAKRLQSHLQPQELLTISRIVLVDENSPASEAVHRAIRVEGGTAEVQDSNFFGLQIKHAYIITSKKQNVVAAMAT